MSKIQRNNNIETDMDTKPMLSTKSDKKGVKVKKPNLNFMAASEKFMTPDDIIKKQQKEMENKMNQIMNHIALKKKVNLEDEVGIEIKDLRSELNKHYTIINHKSQKREGISFQDLSKHDIYHSFDLSEMTDTKGDKGTGKAKTLYDKFIFNEDNNFLYFWKFIHSLASLFSSYYYIYVAAFISIQPYDPYWIIDIVFMSIFLVSILLEFVTEYVPKG